MFNDIGTDHFVFEEKIVYEKGKEKICTTNQLGKNIIKIFC